MIYLGSNQLNLEQIMDIEATVYLNVGGKRFEILWNTLGQYPTSRDDNKQAESFINHFII